MGRLVKELGLESYFERQKLNIILINLYLKNGWWTLN
jgi:hypothetical protein